MRTTNHAEVYHNGLSSAFETRRKVPLGIKIRSKHPPTVAADCSPKLALTRKISAGYSSGKTRSKSARNFAGEASELFGSCTTLFIALLSDSDCIHSSQSGRIKLDADNSVKYRICCGKQRKLKIFANFGTLGKRSPQAVSPIR